MAETVAALLLRAKLYRIRARRVKTPLGEIDLVAQKADMLVFVEVKARASASGEFGAHMAVDRRRITAAANWYLSRHPRLAELSQRFDVIFLAPGTWPRHISNAFDQSR